MQEAPLELSDAPMFQGLSLEEASLLRQRVDLRSFAPGSHLLESGQDAPGVYVIRSGAVAVVVRDLSGREREIATLGKGECAGEMALMTSEPCSATLRAITATEAWLIEASGFADLVEGCPGLWRNLARILSQRLVRTSRRLSERPYANTVALVMDCPDDGAAALAIAIAASLARQTAKRTLLLDGRSEPTCSVSKLAPEQSLPSLSRILRDKGLLKQHEATEDRANGLWGARVASLRDAGHQDLTEDEKLTVLDWLRPLYDFVLLLVRREAAELSHFELEHARSVIALATDRTTASIPSWLESLISAPGASGKVDVAMSTEVLSGPPALQATENLTGRPVTRLLASGRQIQEMAADRSFLAGGEGHRRLHESVDRLARKVGEVEVGLALGAGAAKGFAHIGVLKVLEEKSVPIDFISGCSIGAVVGALYAMGRSLAEIERHLQGADRKLSRWTIPVRSIWSDAGLKEMLRAPAPTVRFRDLQVPFAAVATDIATGREVTLRKGLLWRAVQASTSVPGMFPPTLSGGRHLVDGGLVNPVPSQTARDLGADIVVAVDLMSPAGRTYHDFGSPNAEGGTRLGKAPNLAEMLWRSTEIMQEEVTLRSAATSDVTIEPKLGRVRWSDFSQRGRDFIAAGEAAAREKLPELRRILPFSMSSD